LVVLLAQGCGEDLVAPDPGVIRVTVATTGPEPDPDGYTIQLDTLAPVPVAATATADYGVSAGDHTVELGGIAANCAVQTGSARQSVQVDPRDTVVVAFELLCSATTGALAVTTVTTGGSLDADGYTLAVDGGGGQAIGINETQTLRGLAAGDHTVALSGVAANCSLTGDNPRTVTVTAGATDTSTFAVTCLGTIATWKRVSPGTTADLTDVWPISPTELFLVGETGNASTVASVIRRFDGTQWVEQHREKNLRLRGLWGSSPTDIYAVGYDFVAPIARMLHYDGANWTEVPGFVSDAEQLSFEAVWGSSATDVWAVGGAFDGEFDRTLIYHLTGGFWQRTLLVGNLNPSLTDVWGSGPNDVYAVGHDMASDPGQGVVLRYDGTLWSPVLQQDGLVLNGVWGSSASDVFAAGFQVTQDATGQFTVTSAIWHYDGSAWSPMTVPRGDAVLQGIWGSSPSDVYAVGSAGLILHYDGNRWTSSHHGADDLLAVSGLNAGDAYAVGDNGRVLHGVP
jgi:hypothetical protein